MSTAIAERAAKHGRVAIDTEFVSERRYQAQLCLVSVAVPDADGADGVHTEVLDPLDEASGFDPSPLARVLADPEVEVVVHAGRQDVAILRRTWDTDITHVFDTQVAAGFLGFGNQEGYESLVKRVLDVRLRGGEGFTRWDKRPLTPTQIDYAADDARCLLALGDALERDLDERGRLEWALEECRAVQESRDERTPERAYERLPKVGRLDAPGRAIARRLSNWREGIAREMDRPPAFVVPDQALVELARRKPGDKGALENIRGLPQQTLHRRGAELIAEIEAGRHSEPPPSPPVFAAARPRGGAPRVAGPGAGAPPLDGERRGHRADRHTIGADRAGGRRARGVDGADVRALHGWRRELVGDELSALIGGRLSVSVKGDGGLEIREAG